MNKLQKIIAIGTALTTIITMSGLTYFAPVASATPAEDIQVQIDALTKQLADLQKQLAGLEGTPATTYEGIPADFQFTKLLKKGSKGDEVKYLQIILREEVGEDVVGPADGSFGKKTDAATKTFQTDNSLTADGLVGKNTRAALNALLAAAPVVNELTVASISPASNATSVAVGSNVTVTLSMAVDSATVTADSVKLTAGTTAVIATTTVSDKVITIDPTASLAENTTYTVALTTAVKATDGTALKAAYSSSFSTGTTVIPPVTAAGLTVALAGPASATITSPNGLVSLADFKFTAGSEGTVKITKLKIKRIGVSADTDITNLYLFDGTKRITDNLSLSSSYVTISDSTGIFTVAAGTSKTISVKAEIASSKTGTIGFEITANDYITSDASAVSGAPVTGNLMSMVSTSSLATVSVGAPTTHVAANTALDPANDVTVWKSTLSVGTRKLYLDYFRLRTIGSVDKADLENFRLYVDGTQIGTAVKNMDDNMNVIFDLTAAPQEVKTGARMLELRADVIGGSSKNFTMSLRYKADLLLKDSEYLAYIAPSGTFPANAGQQTISSGSVVLAKAGDSPSGDIVKDASDATLAKYTIKAYGEKVKVETLRAQFAWTNSDSGAGETVPYLRNGRVVYTPEAGDQVSSSSANLYEDSETSGTTYTTYNFGSSLILEPGKTGTLEIRADVYDNDGTDSLETGDTITINIDGADTLDNAQGMTSLTLIDVPGADQAANALTVRTGSLYFSKNNSYGNTTVVAGTNNVKMGSFILQSTAAETINVSTLTVTFTDADSDWATSDFSNLRLSDAGGKISAAAKSSISVSGNNAFAVNFSLAPNEQIIVDVLADIASTATAADEIVTNLVVTALGATTGTDASQTVQAGQTITVAASTLTVAAITTDDSAVLADVVVGGTDGTTIGKFRFKATHSAYTITEITVKLNTAASSDAVEGVILEYPSTAGTVTTAPKNPILISSDYYATFGSLSMIVPANDANGAIVSVKMNLNEIGTGLGTSGRDVKIVLDGYKYTYSSGAGTVSGQSYAGNSKIVRKSRPTLLSNSLATANGYLTTSLASATDLITFDVTANAKGKITLKKLKFEIIVSDALNATSSLAVGGTGGWALFNITDDPGRATDLGFLFGDGAGNADPTFRHSASAQTLYAQLGASANGEVGILAGTTKRFALIAAVSTISAVSTEIDKVSTRLASGDASNSSGAITTNTNNLVQIAAADAVYVWSDYSADEAAAVPHFATLGSSSVDWVNGYKTTTLPSAYIEIKS